MSHDVVVVGSGACGGWAAKQLTEAGLRVLLLEAGEPRRPGDLPAPDQTLDRSPALVAEARERQPVQLGHACFGRQSRHLFVDDVDNPYTTPADRRFDWIRSRQEGGRTLVWGGVTPRFSDYELAAASRDGFGEDWPLRHDDLAPHYETVETFWGVCGAADGLAQIPDGRFRPAKPMTAAEVALGDAIAARWPDRRLIISRGVPATDISPTGWPTYTSQGSTLAAALHTGRLTLQSGAIVRSVETTPDGRSAMGVRVVDRATGQERSVRARVVFLCASTIETTRILLSSANAHHPEGLANSSGTLGHYLMDHPSIGVFGSLSARSEAVEPLGGPHGVCLPRFRNLEQQAAGFIRGYMIWGGAARQHPAIQDPGSRFMFFASAEMLPRFENAVTLDPERRDAWGIPAVHVDCRLSDNERALLADARTELGEMLAEAGLRVEHEDAPSTPGAWVHEVGTARMGRDARTSVLNGFNQAWDVPNLFVTDGAAFPSSGCQNPTLTMAALTVRACAYAKAALERGEL